MSNQVSLSLINQADEEVDRSLSTPKLLEKITDAVVRIETAMAKGDHVNAGRACTAGKNYFMALRRRCRGGTAELDDPLAGIALGEGVMWGDRLRYVKSDVGYRPVTDQDTDAQGNVTRVYVSNLKSDVRKAKDVMSEFRSDRLVDTELEVTCVAGFRCFIGQDLNVAGISSGSGSTS